MFSLVSSLLVSLFELTETNVFGLKIACNSTCGIMNCTAVAVEGLFSFLKYQSESFTKHLGILLFPVFDDEFTHLVVIFI